MAPRVTAVWSSSLLPLVLAGKLIAGAAPDAQALEESVPAGQQPQPLGAKQAATVYDADKISEVSTTLWSATHAVALERSVIAGLSTTIGAGVVLALRGDPTPSHMAFALSLAGGVMMTVSVVELFVPLLLFGKNLFTNLACTVAGVLGFLALKYIVPEPEYTSYHPKACDDNPEDGAACDGPSEAERGRQWKVAVLLTVALTAHNFPEGLAVAVTSMQSSKLGFTVMAAIAIHNIPEGIAIAMPVLEATGSRMKAILMATASGLAEPLGAIVALTMIPEGVLEGSNMDGLLCGVGGIMSCVAAVELFPEAKLQRRPGAAIAGALTGCCVMLVTHEMA